MKCLAQAEYAILGAIEAFGATGDAFLLRTLNAMPSGLVKSLRDPRGLWRMSARLLPSCHCGGCFAPELTPEGKTARLCYELVNRGGMP